MKNRSQPLPSSRCPAQNEWWDLKTFRSYYLPLNNNDPIIHFNPSPIEEIKPSPVDKRSFKYKDVNWVDSGIKITWSRGKITHQHFDGLVEWDHWHTTFMINECIVHIDFISFFHLGPQTGCREYRVFADGVVIGRGGGFYGFLGGNFTRTRNWPLAIEIGGNLLYITKPLQAWQNRSAKGKIDDTDSCLILNSQ
jgi:hypothetical protein